MNTGTPPAIRATGLVKRFGKHTAVDGVDLEVAQGEVVAFLGPNGAGKTTTIDMILGLGRPDAGSVELFGMSPRAAIARGLVSAVMQTGGLLKDLTVRDIMRLNASLFTSTIDVDDALERAGILQIAARKVEKCSGGEQQRLRFAMALLSDPGLLILDEPTTGMDVEGRRSFWNAIHADAARGRTVVFATHYLEEADQYADRIVLIRQGRIVADGSAAEIKSMAAGRTVEAVLEGAEANRAELEPVLRALPGVEQVELRGDRVKVRTASSDDTARHLLTATAAHDVTITSQNLEQAFLQLTGDATERANAEAAR
ncbi:multidrug ABC transporter ATP-binding protein [Leucobacter sp. OLJS4]|uniref:ABC transporter ATP-binding protein n=1 Tax=unclassified Leucobacter TaxID=2621730 RepID=UPI000C47D71E|nr:MULTISPECIES: ABC transporter ATP-binding protein [unclassified Leucobacter]PII82406.1 multidrug ABC transporter ATP-binding protein [Leucobacter sp. OLCALW19]PII87413.1 multidrug ABC transporter ATP-binding protein [Leucobacter sp. OLTLW20]PII94530.1 multidrug ABC transporter ATP-binding protein [Leucobacter sp. OLAS13]PIJ00671.1 multidrug ABC transporter ATP-binding protein [Leucobacter sp. OLDS2]PIJ01363.1 multidrug ABC transporter ATP-binding protein [Leucobacter sp. OLCS4]